MIHTDVDQNKVVVQNPQKSSSTGAQISRDECQSPEPELSPRSTFETLEITTFWKFLWLTSEANLKNLSSKTYV